MRHIALILPSIALLALLGALGGCTETPTKLAAPVEPSPLDKRSCPAVAITYADPVTIDKPWSGGIKDFCVVATGTDYHLFHITDPATSWTTRAGELTFGHASAGDLSDWSTHERIDLRTGPVGWSPSFTWAPHIIRNDVDGLWYMFYTGVKWDHGTPLSSAEQRVGLAVSADLFTWKRYNEHGEDGLILEGPPHDEYFWSAYDTDEVDLPWEYDCRDPFVFDRGSDHIAQRYVMLNSVRLAPYAQYMAIAYATSDDLVHWQWQNILPVTVGVKAESASLVAYAGQHYLFWTDRDDAPSVRVACSISGVFGEYVPFNAGEALFGLANETVVEAGRTLYLAFDDYYVLHIKQDLMLPEVPSPTAPVRVVDFTECDLDELRPDRDP